MFSTNILQGKHVQLTALDQTDLKSIAGWYRDAGLLRLLDAAPAMPKTENELQSWMAAGHKDKNSYLFAVRLIDSEDIIGFVEFNDILWNNQTGWMSIVIGGRDHWDQHYGSEALALALRFAFHELNLHRVSLNVFSYNQRAIALYEKLGFRQEGIQREALNRDGQRHDMIWYGLLRREWEAQAADL